MQKKGGGCHRELGIRGLDVELGSASPIDAAVHILSLIFFFFSRFISYQSLLFGSPIPVPHYSAHLG
jgi:hypothetical protein